MAQVIRFVHFAEPHFLKLNIKVHPTNPDTIFSVNDSSLSFKDYQHRNSLLNLMLTLILMT